MSRPSKFHDWIWDECPDCLRGWLPPVKTARGLLHRRCKCNNGFVLHYVGKEKVPASLQKAICGQVIL